eukprot:TRINITY_DN6623_c0_g1_i1.p2 TRINITY_DN6623_c0_g1~~TRINITY_DN6623_c0_g1_i1.p2  ORF type:complete len:99 (-),score=2.29 TRINITY_DN6623_c0_g1_i1:205-501(-)
MITEFNQTVSTQNLHSYIINLCQKDPTVFPKSIIIQKDRWTYFIVTFSSCSLSFASECGESPIFQLGVFRCFRRLGLLRPSTDFEILCIFLVHLWIFL